MGNRIRHHPCKFCGALVLKHDLRNGKVIYLGKVLSKGPGRTIVAKCPKCKRDVTLPDWNPLVLD